MKLKVFIVDDDPIYNRVAMFHLLNSNKNIKEVKCFSNGDDLLKALNEKPDIIFLDYHFEGFLKYTRNGLSLLKSIRFRCPEINCYIVSGTTDEELIKRFITEGAVAVLKKNSVVFSELEQIIKLEIKWRNQSTHLYQNQRFFYSMIRNNWNRVKHFTKWIYRKRQLQ